MARLPITQRARCIDASGIRKVFDIAQRKRQEGSDLIDLSIGQPDFFVPEPIKAAAIEAIQSDKSGYTVTQGIAPLRERIVDHYRKQYGNDPDGLLVTAGVSGGLLLALLATVEAGDEVIVLDPYFVMYKHLVTLTGATSVIVETYDDFSLPLDRIAEAITERTRVIIVNSPGNPTGCVYSADELKGLAEVAEKHDLLVLSDEIYRSLWYDAPPASLVSMIPHRTILLDGFSKSHAVTGWRVGFATGPAAIIEQMTKLQQYTFVCSPSFAQYGMLAMDQCDPEPNRSEYAARRDLVFNGLREVFDVQRPAGGFYIFPKSPVQPASRFVEMALDRDVLIIPGNVFSERDTHFRISYARQPDQLQRGVDILCELAQQAKAMA